MKADRAIARPSPWTPRPDKSSSSASGLSRPKSINCRCALRLGPTAVKSPLNNLIPFQNQPTGLALTADHTLAAVITYYGVFLFPRKPEESWAAAFAKPPTALPPHLLGQAESVAFAKDGKTIYALSEGRGSPVVHYQIQPPTPAGE